MTESKPPTDEYKNLGGGLELLFLHALPLDGSMWAAQMDLLPGRAYAPTLYGFGNTIDSWAELSYA